MDWLMAWPSLVKLAAIFALMLTLVRVKVNVGWALCAGAALCGYWFGLDTAGVGRGVAAAMTDLKYDILVAIIMLVLVLNHSLEQGGQIQRIVEAFFRISRRPRTTLVFFPALLGLLPMPGGAQFSAPMVDAAGTPLGLSAEQKTLINYWFRHIWEYCWILYPGIILSSQLAGYQIWAVSLAQAPLAAGVAVIGYFFFLKKLDLRHRVEGENQTSPLPYPLPSRERGEEAETAEATATPDGKRHLTAAAANSATALHDGKGGAVRAFLAASAPVWLVIVAYAAMKMAYVGVAAAGLAPERFVASDFAKHNLDNSLLVAGICLSIVYTWVTGRMGAGAVWRVIWQKDMYQNLMIGVGIIVFAGVLGASGAASRVAEDLERLRIPIWLVAMLLPFTVGVITGITMNMVVLTYPIVLLALKGAGQEHLAIPYCVLAFAAGYAGVLITPLHICMLQSNAYFGLGATATLRPLAAPVALTVVAGAGLFLLYLFVFPHMGWGPGSHVIPAVGR